jgi:UPF0755 protein
MLKQLFRLFSFVLVIGTFVTAWLFIDYREFLDSPVVLGDKPLYYEVKPGANMRVVARDLEKKGAIKHWIYLAGLAQWQKKAHLIKAGEYEFPSGSTPQQLLDQLVAGKVLEYSFTIVEGWTFRQMIHAMQRNRMLKHTLVNLNDQDIMARLGHPGEHPEGRFYPDTYHFPRHTTDVDFLQRAYRAMNDYLEGEWGSRDPNIPLNTPYEALIMASIVEKETGRASERKTIAGVFLRRLQKTMRLQTDPTVIYGMGAMFDGDLRRSDLTRDTPYNTYTRDGLPPTPIALPGPDAIHAVLHPESGDSLYFVARGDGSHEFSDTLKQHNNAVRRHQLKNRPAGTESNMQSSEIAPP